MKPELDEHAHPRQLSTPGLDLYIVLISETLHHIVREVGALRVRKDVVRSSALHLLRCTVGPKRYEYSRSG